MYPQWKGYNMALTDAKVRNAKVPTGKKSLKLSDGEGRAIALKS